MEKLPTNIIQLIFVIDIKIWPILRLACKRFLKISKSNYVVKRIIETSSMHRVSKADILKKQNIYNELLAISKTHYNFNYATEDAYLDVEDPSFQVQTFYGIFNVHPVIYGVTKHRIYGDMLVSPLILKNYRNINMTNTIKSYVKYIYRATELSDCNEGPFMRCDKSSYLMRFSNFINLPKILNFIVKYKQPIFAGAMILIWMNIPRFTTLLGQAPTPRDQDREKNRGKRLLEKF